MECKSQCASVNQHDTSLILSFNVAMGFNAALSNTLEGPRETRGDELEAQHANDVSLENHAGKRTNDSMGNASQDYATVKEAYDRIVAARRNNKAFFSCKTYRVDLLNVMCYPHSTSVGDGISYKSVCNTASLIERQVFRRLATFTEPGILDWSPFRCGRDHVRQARVLLTTDLNISSWGRGRHVADVARGGNQIRLGEIHNIWNPVRWGG